MLIETLGRPVDADVVVPGSKSITNRALICATLAEGVSTLSGVLDADDTHSSARLSVAYDEWLDGRDRDAALHLQWIRFVPRSPE